REGLQAVPRRWAEVGLVRDRYPARTGYPGWRRRGTARARRDRGRPVAGHGSAVARRPGHTAVPGGAGYRGACPGDRGSGEGLQRPGRRRRGCRTVPLDLLTAREAVTSSGSRPAASYRPPSSWHHFGSLPILALLGGWDSARLDPSAT